MLTLNSTHMFSAVLNQDKLHLIRRACTLMRDLHEGKMILFSTLRFLYLGYYHRGVTFLGYYHREATFIRVLIIWGTCISFCQFFHYLWRNHLIVIPLKIFADAYAVTQLSFLFVAKCQSYNLPTHNLNNEHCFLGFYFIN